MQVESQFVYSIVLAILSILIIGSALFIYLRIPAFVGAQNKTIEEMGERITLLERSDRQKFDEIVRLQNDLAIERSYSRALARYSQEMTHYSGKLAGMLRQFMDDVPPPPEPPMPPPELQPAPRKTARPMPSERDLQASMASHFSLEELDDVAFQLGINTDDIDGTTIGKRSRSLLAYARRRGLQEELVELFRRMRPEVEI